MSKNKTAIVIATKQQLAEIGIEDVPNGALVEVYEVDQFTSVHGPASKIRYKFEKFDYIMPTKWLLI